MVGNTPAAGSSPFRGAGTVFVAVVFALTSSPTFAQDDSEPTPAAPSRAPLTPVADLEAGDVPDDGGRAVYLSWPAMPYDGEGVEYVVEIATETDGPFVEVERFGSTTQYKSDVSRPFWMWSTDPDAPVHYVEISQLPAGVAVEVEEDGRRVRRVLEEEGELEAGETYYVRLVTVRGDERAESDPVEVVPRANWFAWAKLHNFLYMVLFSAIILLFIEFAKRRDLFLRRIPGLNAVEDAVGRATELGKPIYYLTGRQDINEISTIAASIILGEIAKKAATYDVALRVPHTYPLTMAVCREITREAYLKAGRPDTYRDEINFFLTEDQFSYTAAVDGMMMRERPGACFYMGYYYAESLLLAEAGAQTGAIQIAGTDAVDQLPFFVTTCDFTLIGEELYAASAYLSRKPELVGTLRGQDVGKTVIIFGILFGVIGATLAAAFDWTGVDRLLDFFRNF